MLEWNVYYYNCNGRKIESFNIFDHGSFREDMKKAAKKIKNKEDFEKQLKSNLMYYMWSKSEWEIILAPWVGGDRDRDAIKIDVYDQIMLNWNIFVEYCWNNRIKLSKIKSTY